MQQKAAQTLIHVLVSGGTHGNEYTGAYLARQWLNDSSALTRSTFKAHVLFGNPEAFQINRRYVDHDLNRSFTQSVNSEQASLIEFKRAAEIQKQLKSQCDGRYPDVIFDLHSTTSHMGLSLVLAHVNAFNLQLYAFLRTRFPRLNAYVWHDQQAKPGFLNSLTENGFAIEVGPVANCVLDARQILATNALVQACLDFVELLNSKAQIAIADSVPLYRFIKHVDYPRSADGFPSFFIHPELQDKDFCELSKGSPIFMNLKGDVVTWQEDAVWPVFINEAAYYEKGIAFTATQKTEITSADINRMQNL